jgi:hypothetical protein
MVNLSYHFCNLFTLLFKVSYFICGIFRGWLGYEIAGFAFGDKLFSISLYSISSFSGSIWFIPFLSTYGVSFGPLGIGYRFLFLVG